MEPDEALVKAGVSYRQLSGLIQEKTGYSISKTTVQRAVRCAIYPKRFGVERFRSTVNEVLADHGVGNDIEWHGQRRRVHGEKCEVIGRPFDVWGGNSDQQGIQEIELMQLDEEVLTYFGLRTNPFENDMDSEADVFRTKAYERCERELRRAIADCSMLALISPSGAGKTTIWEGIEAELLHDEKVVLSKPHATDRERLRPSHLSRALLLDLLGEGTRISTDVEGMSRQMGRALKQARRDEKRVVLYIDDAHFMSRTLLRQIKRFYELKIGRDRLLAIVMVGIEGLKTKLDIFPEVGERTRILEVPPVGVESYLKFKLERVGSLTSRIFTGDGIKAFLERFRGGGKRAAVGHPLAINAACIRTMVAFKRTKPPDGEKVTRELVEKMPVRTAARRAA